eukprot:8129395-Pyramimonas_sp.AAC.1
MEDELCHRFDLCEGAGTPCRGRAGGFRRREVQLQLLLRRRWEDGVSPKGRPWKSLQGLLHNIRGLWAGPDIP